MIDPPYLTTADAHPAALIHLTVHREAIAQAIGPAIAELHATLAEQGVEPAGPPFCHHLHVAPDLFELEVGVPVLDAFEPRGRVVAGMLPSLRVVRTQYRGPYTGLAEAWGELRAWMDDTAHPPAEDLWEFYLAGPESGEDPAHWRTELNWPLQDQPKGRPRDLVDR